MYRRLVTPPSEAFEVWTRHEEYLLKKGPMPAKAENT